MAKPIIIPAFAYKSPRCTKRGTGHKGLRSTLKYLEFCEDRDKPAKKERRDRWQDRGLGAHYRGIFEACDRLQNPHVLAWMWVISPAPDLVALVPEDQRRPWLMDLTERIVEEYYAERGFQTPPYSFVQHDRLTKGGETQLHTHVILPGLAPTVEGWEPVYNRKGKKHEQLFNQIAIQECEAALDRAVGPEWRRLRQEPEVKPPDIPLDINDLDAWFPR
ncbi:MAG: hypothetical protein HY866_01345 [Chloroflexi bacterium]|nr:hypothetical protein [Chloroflexota bacterium]